MHDIHDQLAQFNNADDSLELLKSNLKTIKMINRSSSVMTIICTECSIRVYHDDCISIFFIQIQEAESDSAMLDRVTGLRPCLLLQP